MLTLIIVILLGTIAATLLGSVSAWPVAPFSGVRLSLLILVAVLILLAILVTYQPGLLLRN